MQYDFEAGRLDETVHPFATALNPGDVRITTRYLPNDITSALFGTIHEGGHALYEQNISTDLSRDQSVHGYLHGDSRVAVPLLGKCHWPQQTILGSLLQRASDDV